MAIPGAALLILGSLFEVPLLYGAGLVLLLSLAAGSLRIWFSDTRASAVAIENGVEVFRYPLLLTRGYPILVSCTALASLAPFFLLGGTVDNWIWAAVTLAVSALAALGAYQFISGIRRNLIDVALSNSGIEWQTHDGQSHYLPWSEVVCLKPAGPDQLAGHGVLVVGRASEIAIYSGIRGIRILKQRLRAFARDHELPVEEVRWGSVGIVTQSDMDAP